MVEKKELKEMFRDFLYNLEKFLEASALYLEEHTGIIVLYIQEPQDIGGDVLYAKGLIQIRSHTSSLEVRYVIDFDDIEIRSKFFEYHIRFEEMKEFLAQIHGGDSE